MQTSRRASRGQMTERCRAWGDSPLAAPMEDSEVADARMRAGVDARGGEA